MNTRKNEARWIEDRERWQINVQKNGERKTFTSATPGKKGKIAAEHKADAWLEDSVSAVNSRVDKLLDEYVKHLEASTSKGHARQYKGYIENHIKPVVGMKRINAITEGDLQDVVNLAYSKSKLSAKTLKNIRACLANFMKWCRQHGKTMLHPEALIIPRGAKPSEKTVLSPDSLRILFTSDRTRWKGRPASEFYIHAYRFAVLTGLRPGELRGIEKKDIRAMDVSIKRSINIDNELTTGKNDNARRTFRLSQRARDEVDAQLAMLKQSGVVSPYLFPNKEGDAIGYDHFCRAWVRYCEENGIPHISLYEMMRHTFVSVNKKMPDGLKKTTVGHSRDMDTEGTYGHIMEGDLEEAAEFVEQAFDEILKPKKTAEK